MFINRRNVHIEWGDCDPAGIVYFPRFFEFFDASTAALFEAAGFPKPEMLKKYGLVGMPLVDARAQFFAPATFGETVEIESKVKEWGKSSFIVEHKLYNGSRLAAEGFEKRVWTAKDLASGKMKGQAIPEEVKERLR